MGEHWQSAKFSFSCVYRSYRPSASIRLLSRSILLLQHRKRHMAGRSACIKTIAGIVRVVELWAHRKKNNKNSHLFAVVYLSHSFRSSKWTRRSCLIDSIDLFACVSWPMVSTTVGWDVREWVGSSAIVYIVCCHFIGTHPMANRTS